MRSERIIKWKALELESDGEGNASSSGATD